MAKFLKNPANESIYKCASQMWHKCFLADGALLFTQSLWTLENLKKFHEDFVVNADEGKGTFFEKLHGQISNSGQDVIRLVAEIVSLYYLFPSISSISGKTKLDNVNRILSWCDESIENNHIIVQAFNCGIGGVGTAYMTKSFEEIGWLLDVLISLKKLSLQDRNLLNDPWAFYDFINAVPMKGNRQSKHTILHIIFPDTFERIATLDNKKAVASTFKEYVRDIDSSIDKQLFDIRNALENKYKSKNLDFYNPPLNIWIQNKESKKEPTLEIQFKEWLTRQRQSNGKSYAASTIYQYVRALKSATKKIEGVELNNTNLFCYTSQATFAEVHKRIVAAPNFEALNAAWASGTYAASMERYKVFLKEYEEASLDDEVEGGATGDVTTDAYSLQSIRDEGCFLSLAALERMFSRLHTKKNIILQGPPGTGKTWLAKRLAWALVGEKNSHRVQALQFHATLSYEDFVCGWRPVGDGKLALLDGPFLEALTSANEDPETPYVLVIEEINRGNPAQIFGELLTLLEADKRIPEEALRLCYKSNSDAPVHLPANLHLIGTMNIADRSLAIVDFALRRRFSFFDLTPNFGEDWQNWMRDRAGLHTAFVATLGEAMQTCNSAIAGDPSLGPQYAIGHSFVTYDRPIPDARTWIEGIVAAEITPLLKEYWFNDPKKAEETAQKILDALP